MKQFWLQIIILLIITFTAMALYYKPGVFNDLFGINFNSPVVKQTTPKVNNKLGIFNAEGKPKVVVTVEVANTAALRAQGLGGRESLLPEAGMLFVFEKPAKYNFWMKGLKFPLDFIWILDDKVVDILPNVPQAAADVPDNALNIYTSVREFDKVLEVNAGFVSAYKVEVGDRVKFISE